MSAPDRIRIVVVTMDSHLVSAASRAERALRADFPGLTLAVHAADGWAGDEEALAACRDAIASADIVVATMLFLDAHVRPVLDALAARRESCRAMLCCLSASPVVKLTTLGRFSMSGEAGGAIALLKRLRGGAGKHASGEAQMRMLRRIPRLLRFIPGTAQDARCYFLALQYWLAGSDENISLLARMLVERYALPVPRTGRVAPPIEYPDVGVYHPAIPGRTGTDPAVLPRRGHAGTVGVLLMRSYVLAGNTAHYDAAIAALENRGLNVIPVFAAGLDARPAIARYLSDGRIDALLSLTGFSLVGGPAYNDANAAETVLAALDVPYVAAHALEFQTIEAWERDPRGLSPVEAAMMVALPELDGATWPMPFAGRTTGPDMVPHAERVGRLAARVGRLVALRRTPPAERRVAIVLFAFPPNAGAAGTAAFLDVFASLHNTLRALRDDGVAVDLPADVDALRDAVLGGNATLFGTEGNVAATVTAADHVRREPHLAAIERSWGPAPGRHNSDGSRIRILGAQLGHVFVGLQPAFGTEGDPMRLLFEHGMAPTHAFSAFYRWIREDFAADAVLHFGTHGALEFMPGKHAGPSGACWPDRLIGDLPNIYLYACNNPSEGALARRRSGAILVSHLTPPLGRAGLYRGLLDLHASIDRWRRRDGTDDASLAELIQTEAAALDLAAAAPAWADPASEIEALRARIFELEQTLIPHGLHVVGTPPTVEARSSMLDAAGIDDPARRALLDAHLASDAETAGLLRALAGRFIRPAPAGDLVRTPELLPTGRNLHGLDVFRMPSAFAMREGARQAARLLARHAETTGAVPGTVALVLWGTDNLKTEGGPIAQALALLGAEPRHDSYGRVCGAQLVPLATLGRPRIDVLVTVSGIFRDLLPLQVQLLAEAALLAAEADEPEDANFVAAHARAYAAREGCTIREAALRVFGNAADAYGANVNHLVDAGAWNNEDDLAEAFCRRKGFAYGTDGRAQPNGRVLAHLLGGVDLAFQNLESVELGVTTIDHYFDNLGGIARAAARAGAAPAVYIADSTRGGDATVRTVAEQVALETRTRALNPRWYEAMLAHGSEGVRHLECQVTNTLGWSATTGAVEPWVYQRLSETFLLDRDMRERLARLNPTASARLAGRLLEASERRYWAPSPETLAELRDANDAIEDMLEGVAA